MPITIFTQSKKDTAPVYIRVREGGNTTLGKGIDAKARTQFYVSTDRLVKGVFKDYKSPKGASAEIKAEVKKKNIALNKVKRDILNLVGEVSKRLNSRKEYEKINSEWLKEVINPNKESVTTLVVDYFDVYFKSKKSSIRQSTVKKLKSIQSRLRKYEQDNKAVYIAEVDRIFKNNLFDWLDSKGYAHNTKLKMLKVIVTICNHAKEKRGLLTHPDLNIITKHEKYIKTPHVYLNQSDLKKIKEVELDNSNLDTVRDWLLISCETGQRMSDFLKFSKKNIVEIDKDLFLEIQQEKTLSNVYVYLNDSVKEILDKYKGNFPPVLAINVASNETIYNRLIKEVCRIAKVNESVKANLRQTEKNRYEVKEVLKYKAVSSHIGRRSFATNYYGKLSTELLMSVTGHKTEKQFLDYVGLPPINKAREFAREYKRMKYEQKSEPVLTVVKSTTNG